MSDDEKNNLINFLILFKNRPYHLAKYLIDNSAFTNDFITKISNSDKLSDKSIVVNNFKNISEMEDYYTSLISDSKKPKNELIKELNDKMDYLVLNDEFEEAAKLRDYMIKYKIKRSK